MCYTGDESKKTEKDEVIDPRCIVKFRPADDWKGEYGFDWFREGDYGELTIDDTREDHSITYEIDNRSISKEIKSKTAYKNEKLVGKYFGDFKLCTPVSKIQPVLSKDEFTDANGNIIYSTKSGSKYFVVFHLKELCPNCPDRTNCLYFPINSKDEEPWIDDYTSKPNTVDPDFDGFLIQPSSLKFNKQDSSGNIIQDYEKEFEKRYSPISIQINDRSSSDYFVPTISLFYKNEAMEAENKWGRSSAIVKLLISGNNIDADIQNISFEFECSIGIEIIDSITQRIWEVNNRENSNGMQLVDSTTGKSINKIHGGSINKNSSTNFYEKTIIINLTEDFASFSKNEGDGTIRIFANNSSNGERSLAGKLIVEKCIPKSVDILFVHIPVEVNSKTSRFPNISDQEEYLKQFLNHAHIVPNIKTINVVVDIHTDTKQKLVLLEKLDKIIDAHRNSTKDKLCAIKDNHEELSKQLEKLINNECPKYRNFYKIFLLGAAGEDVAGMAAGIPSKAAVIFGEDVDSSTICHELLHCFGLYHSFSNNSPYTVEKYKTSNIMDYPETKVLLTLWKWQWDKIRNADGMKFQNVDCIENKWSLIV